MILRYSTFVDIEVETSETLYSEDIRITSDLAEGEAVEAFDAETNGALHEEPVEQA